MLLRTVSCSLLLRLQVCGQERTTAAAAGPAGSVHHGGSGGIGRRGARQLAAVRARGQRAQQRR